MSTDTPEQQIPAWLCPGIWVRNKCAPYEGRAFVMFVDEGQCKGGFQYHLEVPWKNRATDEGWQTGGTCFNSGLESWEQCPGPHDPIPTPRSEPTQRDAVLEEALRNFLVLRTDAPNFVAFFTGACFCAEHALKGNVDPISGGGGADVTSIGASQTGHAGSAGNGGSLYFPSKAAIIRYSFDKNGKPYMLDQREAERDSR